MEAISLTGARLLLLPFALAWCVLMIIARTAWTWNTEYLFLVWNLGLAWIPFLLSGVLAGQSNLGIRLVVAPLWLLFLPNAPYVVTDFVHFRTMNSGPWWLDLIMLLSCSGMGLIMGYASLWQVHGLLNRAHRPVLGWCLALASLFLCGFGIYLGRFLRWRSVDVFQHPWELLGVVLERVFKPASHPRAWAVTLGFGMFLCVGYLLFVAVACKAPQRRTPALA